MAQGRVSKGRPNPGKPPTSPDDSEDGTPNRSDPESSGDDKVSKMAAKMRQEARARRLKRRANIKKAYGQSVEDMELAMTTTFDKILGRIVDTQKLRLEKISELLRRKATIEAKMLGGVKNIENAYVLADKILESAFARRLQDSEKHRM